jgi:hypothetical protein
MGAWESSISDLMRLALLGMIRGVWGLLICTSRPPTPVDMDFDQRYTKTVLSNSIIKVARDSLKLRICLGRLSLFVRLLPLLIWCNPVVCLLHHQSLVAVLSFPHPHT